MPDSALPRVEGLSREQLQAMVKLMRLPAFKKVAANVQDNPVSFLSVDNFLIYKYKTQDCPKH